MSELECVLLYKSVYLYMYVTFVYFYVFLMLSTHCTCTAGARQGGVCNVRSGVGYVLKC